MDNLANELKKLNYLTIQLLEEDSTNMWFINVPCLPPVGSIVYIRQDFKLKIKNYCFFQKPNTPTEEDYHYHSITAIVEEV